MKIAITGGAGFIGTALATLLKDAGHEIRILDVIKSEKFPNESQIVDVTNPHLLTEALQGIDVIYHMAAVHRDDVKPLQRYYTVNVGGAENVVAAAKANNIKTIVNTSSVAVYALDAGDSRETDTPDPFNDYGRSKLAAEKVFETWATADAKNTLANIRLVATFGPGNRGNIYTLIEQIARGRFIMVGDGDNYKSIAWVGNVAAFLTKTLEFSPGTHLYNYADKPDLNMREFVQTVRNALGLKGLGLKIPYSIGLMGGKTFDIIANATGKNFPISAIRVKKFCANTIVNADKAIKQIGFKAPFTLEYGLREMINAEFSPEKHQVVPRKVGDKPRILYILAESEDFWSSRLPLALAAQEKNCEIYVAAPGAGRDEKFKQYGFQGYELPDARKGFSIIAALSNLRVLKNILNDVQPDVVHTVTLKFSFLTGMIAPTTGHTRYVFTIAGLGYMFSRGKLKPAIMRMLLMPYIRLALRHPLAHITFQNSDDQKILVEAGWVRPDSCTLIPGSGVNLDKFTPTPPISNDAPIVLMPTRLVHDKGISVFIEMAKILEARGIPARFQIAGGITDQNPMAITREEMEKMVTGNPVEWLGKVTDMPTLYNSATLIVYPSWYREGIPRVLLEAAATGKAIITTDHPGCREAVAHNDNGLLVPVGDAKATADAVEQLLKNDSRRHTMERRSRERAEKEFDVRIITKQTLKVYGL